MSQVFKLNFSTGQSLIALKLASSTTNTSAERRNACSVVTGLIGLYCLGAVNEGIL